MKRTVKIAAFFLVTSFSQVAFSTSPDDEAAAGTILGTALTGVIGAATGALAVDAVGPAVGAAAGVAAFLSYLRLFGDTDTAPVRLLASPSFEKNVLTAQRLLAKAVPRKSGSDEIFSATTHRLTVATLETVATIDYVITHLLDETEKPFMEFLDLKMHPRMGNYPCVPFQGEPEPFKGRLVTILDELLEKTGEKPSYGDMVSAMLEDEFCQKQIEGATRGFLKNRFTVTSCMDEIMVTFSEGVKALKEQVLNIDPVRKVLLEEASKMAITSRNFHFDDVFPGLHVISGGFFAAYALVVAAYGNCK